MSSLRRGSVQLTGLTEARELAKPRRTPEEVGDLLGVNGRTVRRWEETGWVKLRYVAELETLYGRRLAPAAGTGPARPKPPATDGTSTLDEMRAVAHLYNTRRSQGAPTSELDRLYESLVEAIRSMVTAQMPDDADDELVDTVVETYAERFTRASQPRVEPVAQQRPQAAHARKRRT